MTRHRLLIVWAVLCALTLGYLWLDHSAGFAASTVVTAAAIVIALVKVRIIFREFMEVRHAPVLLCRLTDAWIAIMAVSLLGSYFAGVAVG